MWSPGHAFNILSLYRMHYQTLDTPIYGKVSCATGPVGIYKVAPFRSITFIAPLTLTTTTTHPQPKVARSLYASEQASRCSGPYHEHNTQYRYAFTTPESPNAVSDAFLDCVVDIPTDAAIAVFDNPLPASRAEIHLAITYTGTPFDLCFDLAFPPSYLLDSDSPTVDSDLGSSFSLCVDTTPLSEQTPYPASASIIFLTEALLWPITVTAKPTFATVYDVLQALRSLLGLHVTTTEWGSLSRASQDMIAASFRLKREKQLDGGVGRLDFWGAGRDFTGSVRLRDAMRLQGSLGG